MDIYFVYIKSFLILLKNWDFNSGLIKISKVKRQIFKVALHSLVNIIYLRMFLHGCVNCSLCKQNTVSKRRISD